MSRRLLLVLWTSAIVGFTLAPFDVALSVRSFADRFAQVFQLEDSRSLLKNAAHLASFLVLGILVARTYAMSLARRGLLHFLLIGFTACLLLECAQFFLLERHARLIDFSLNFIGFALGLWSASRTTFGRRLGLSVANPLRWPYLEGGVVAGAVTTWLVIGLLPLFGGLRMSWDKSFPLVIGNEVGGTRPWLGELQYLRIYAEALSPLAVGSSNGTSDEPKMLRLRKSWDLLAGYDFTKSHGTRLRVDGKLQSRALTLDIPHDVDKSKDGIHLKRPTVLRSNGPTTTLSTEIATAGRFSLDLVLRPENLTQKGPARFVTVSSGVAERNFMLGQSGTDLVFRVRNQSNGLNGGIHQLVAAGLLDKSVQRITATYDHGVSTVYKNGTARATIDLREPIYFSHFSTGFVGKAALYSLSVIAISLPAYAFIRRWASPTTAHSATLIFTFIACVAPYGIACVFIGGPWRYGVFAWVTGTLAVIYPAGVLYIDRKRFISEYPGRNPAKGADLASSFPHLNGGPRTR